MMEDISLCFVPSSSAAAVMPSWSERCSASSMNCPHSTFLTILPGTGEDLHQLSLAVFPDMKWVVMSVILTFFLILEQSMSLRIRNSLQQL